MSIKKGDLVMVVKPSPCCGNSEYIGTIYTVFEIGFSSRHWCFYCGFKPSEAAAFNENGAAAVLSRLKKLDPPSEGETREAYVNLKQPKSTKRETV